MSESLETLTHGRIEGGYILATNILRIGEYAFATTDFCETIEAIARGETERTVTNYGSEQVEREGGNILSVCRQLAYANRKSDKAIVNALLDTILDQHPLQMVGVNTPQEAQPLLFLFETQSTLASANGRTEVKITREGHEMQIGDYRVTAEEYGQFAVYAARLGIYGGMQRKRPQFAESALQAIRTSTDAFNEEARRTLRKWDAIEKMYHAQQA